MSPLDTDLSAPAVASNSFILVPHTVTDLEDFTENHPTYLVSVYEEPERAAALWRERLRRNSYGDEGYVALEHYGRNLIAGDLWDHVGGIWSNLVDAIGSFLDHGAAETSFPGQPAPILLRRVRQTTLLTINTETSVVDPATFFPGVLDEAERYFQWVAENIGENVSGPLQAIARIRGRLRDSPKRTGTQLY
ncbi:hypothetical protein [Microbacterium oleivorans]|uniref:Uncharacterized protein n=1 Tax=Microbacterium oleivorans TaxID=273677 RepID=A0A177KD37_9MICO|nr:hypothetical protein [Microbacterium oleivorans]OAH50926.1 hypothetical protein AYL44_01185 [Microbacterium oleivorans]